MIAHEVKEEFKHSLNSFSKPSFREEYTVEEAFRRGVITINNHLITASSFSKLSSP